MHYTVYILYSEQKDRYYVGQTEDVHKRLKEHIIRKNLGTNDWKIVFTEIFETRVLAIRREAEIKSKKRRSYIEALMNSKD